MIDGSMADAGQDRVGMMTSCKTVQIYFNSLRSKPAETLWTHIRYTQYDKKQLGSVQAKGSPVDIYLVR